MAKTEILYQAKQTIAGKHLIAKEWILYSGKLTIYNKKTGSVTLKINSDIADSLLAEMMDDKKEFKGNSVPEVYAKLSKWLYQRGVIFQN